jgi:hypothetical protein
MKNTKFKSTDKMTEKEYVQKFLPVDHNDQDVKYLKERYKWELDNTYPYSNVSKAFQGTTWQKNPRFQIPQA